MSKNSSIEHYLGNLDGITITDPKQELVIDVHKQAAEYIQELQSLESLKASNPSKTGLLQVALNAVRIQTPTLPEIDDESSVDYNAIRCPNPACDKDLSTFIGDGIYSHPEDKTMCYECGQKLVPLKNRLNEIYEKKRTEKRQKLGLNP